MICVTPSSASFDAATSRPVEIPDDAKCCICERTAEHYDKGDPLSWIDFMETDEDAFQNSGAQPHLPQYRYLRRECCGKLAAKSICHGFKPGARPQDIREFGETFVASKEQLQEQF